MIFVFTMGLYALLTFPAAAIVSLVSKYVMSMYGPDFVSGWLTLVIVIWTAAIVAVQEPVVQIIVAASKMWLSFMMNTIWAITMLVLFILMRDMGAIGLALAYLISYILHSGWTFSIAYYLTRAKPPKQVQLPQGSIID